MRVLLLNHEFPPIGAGGGAACAELAAELARAGHAVLVLTGRPLRVRRVQLGLLLCGTLGFALSLVGVQIASPFLWLSPLLLAVGISRYRAEDSIQGVAPRETRAGVEIVRIPMLRRAAHCCSTIEMGSFLLCALARARVEAERFQPDVVHAFFGLPAGPIGWALKRGRGLPYVISLRGADVPSDRVRRFALHYRVLRPVIRALWRDADAVVAVSAGLRQFALETAPDLRIEVVGNGVDPNYFTPGESPPRGPARAARLLFVGRLNAFKNVESLVEVAARLRALRAPDFELIVIGDGSRRRHLEARVERANLGASVRLLGWLPREEVRDHYRAADVFVTATGWEGMPNTLLEAMACGLPIVATRASGIAELARDQVNGYLVEPNDLTTLAERLAELIENAPLRQRMGKESRRIAEAELAWSRASEAYLQVYAHARGRL